MALNIWTKPSGYNLGSEIGTNVSVASGAFIPGLKYVIHSVGTTDFTKIGSTFNSAGIIFTATNSGAGAGPDTVSPVTGLLNPSPGSGIASRIAFTERVVQTINLPVTNDAGVTYSIISGKLPPGMRILGNTITGSPYEVARVTDFTFCVRASKNGEISDRTFTITIEGEDAPEFVTPAGFLNLGDANELFVMDSTYVDYQIVATDADTSAGQRLSYFIARNEGSLPPGLVLTTDGRIVGFIQPTLSITPTDGNGEYDDSTYDNVAYDFAFLPTNGYDSYTYDNVFFDFALTANKPKKLNRTYEFVVTITDGDVLPSTTVTTTYLNNDINNPVYTTTYVSKRKFKIFVVGDDYFRADNTTWLSGNPLFNADVTYLRPPTWLTSSYLGLRRANNYITLILDTYESDNIIYNLEQINANCKATTLKIAVNDNIQGSTTLTTTLTTVVPTVGHFLTFSGLVQEAFRINRVDNVVSLGNNRYRLTLYYPLEVAIPNGIEFLIGTKSELPPGMQFDENNGEVHGLVPYQPAITKTYTFTVTATKLSGKINQTEFVCLPANQGVKISEIRINKADYPEVSAALQNISMLAVDSFLIDPVYISSIDYTNLTDVIIYLSTNIILTADSKIRIQYVESAGERANTPKIFTIDILGEVDSAISWETPSNLGSINANFISTLSLQAVSTIPNATILYTITSGSLPPGLSLDLDGEIVGKVSQYGIPAEGDLGLTTFDFDTGSTTFDGGTTSTDRVYDFTVLAKDQYGYSAISRTFSVRIETPNQLVYSNIRVKPFLKTAQRSLWKDFINNTDVFTPSSIYRPSDVNFGVQSDLSMLIFAGIETKEAATYISAMGLNHKRKRFQFGSLQTAVAAIPGTNNQVYEIIYVEMLDPLEPDGKRLSNKLVNFVKQPNTITVDKSNIIWSNVTLDMEIDAPTSIRPDPILTVDSTGYEVSNPNVTEYFPNSISNWRDRLKNWSSSGQSFSTERNYLPLWMRSIQPGTKQEINFKLAVPLCYCKVGAANDVLLNIRNYIKTTGFSFNQLDYTADRYIIDAVEGLTADKYLVFRNDRITI